MYCRKCKEDFIHFFNLMHRIAVGCCNFHVFFLCSCFLQSYLLVTFLSFVSFVLHILFTSLRLSFFLSFFLFSFFLSFFWSFFQNFVFLSFFLSFFLSILPALIFLFKLLFTLSLCFKIFGCRVHFYVFLQPLSKLKFAKTSKLIYLNTNSIF